MKIQSLILKNFRKHEHLELELGPLTVITGPNGSGKSTIQGALEYVLSGRCAWTDDAGRGGNLAREGSGLGSVTIVAADSQDTATRTTDGVLSLSWRPTAKAQEAQRDLEASMGCLADRARLCLRAGRFLDLDTRAQKALLYELLNLAITPEIVQAELAKVGLVDAARALNAQAPLTDTGRMHKAAYDARTGANRIIKQANAKLAELKKEGEGLAYVTEERVKDLKAERAELQTQLDEINRQEGAQKAQQASIVGLREASHKANCELAAVEEVLATFPQVDAADMKHKREAALLKLQGLHVELGQLNSPSKCDACGSDYVPTDAQDAARLLSQRIAKGRDLVNGIEMLLKKDLDRAMFTERREMREQNAKAARARLNEAVAAIAEASDYTSKRPAVVTRKTYVEEELADAARWQAHSQQLSQSKQDLEQAQAEVKSLNELLIFFGPDGCTSKLLKASLWPFQAAISSVLDRWHMAARHNEADLSLQVQASPDGPWVNYDLLSDGEQVVVGLAHQVAFAQLTGLRIVVLDRIEALDADRQRALMDACLALGDTVDHVILMGVRVDEYTEVIRIDLAWLSDPVAAGVA